MRAIGLFEGRERSELKSGQVEVEMGERSEQGEQSEAKRTALVLGATGQDGSYMCDFLLGKGYEVWAMVRHSARGVGNWRWKELGIGEKVKVVEGDLTDEGSLRSALVKSRPSEIYNLAAQSFVGVSWQQEELTMQVTGLGPGRLFRAVREVCPEAKVYQAGSSEMFGKVQGEVQNEESRFWPRSPYGVAKVAAHWSAVNARESWGLKVWNGILFNHESGLRGEEFVTQKVVKGAVRITRSLEVGERSEPPLVLGNLSSVRDWGYAPEYVEGMWRMLQSEEAEDYVIATGKVASVEEWCKEVFGLVGIEDWRRFVQVDAGAKRPAEVGYLRGDGGKMEKMLGWRPRVDWRGVAERMVEAERARAERAD